MKAMILAAGEGTRLRPLTPTQPKPMLPVAGRPALEWILLWLRAHGIDEAAMNLSYLPDQVQEYFGDGERLGMRLVYSVEETLLGTAGGVKRLQAYFGAPFALVYGDVLTDLNLTDLIAFHRSRPAGPHVTLSLTHVPNPTECGIVDLDATGRITRFVEKPTPEAVFSDLANAGVLILDPEILDAIPEDRFYDFSHELFPRLLAADVPFYGWTLRPDDYLIDIGSHAKYARVQQEWPTPALRRLLGAAVPEGTL